MSNEENKIIPSNSNKIDIKRRKENTVNSLFEVEQFLCNIKNIIKGIKLYNILK